MKTETLIQKTTIFGDGSKFVEYLNSEGKYHNPNGPAYVLYYENGNVERQEFWIEGEELTEEKFNKLQNTKDSCDGEIVEIKGKRYQLKLVK